MASPEFLIAYGIAGFVVATMVLTAFKIVWSANRIQASQPRRQVASGKLFWPPLAPGRR